MEAQDDGRLLRDVLRGSLGVSHRLLHALKYEGEIALNGVLVTVRAKVRAGDSIRLRLFNQPESRVIPEDLPLRVVYEDEDLLVVDKPAGMIVHPVPPEPTGTLANAIAWYWEQRGLQLPVRVITRLDRDTTGLVLTAKHALAQHYYSSEAGVLQKYYLAMVHGRLLQPHGVIDGPIGINPDHPVTRQIDPAGKSAQTAFRRLAECADGSVVEVELLTGRTHQIRVHFAWIGHPLLGDQQYGGESCLINRQALHCRRLTLRHVRTGQELQFESPIPEDMQTVWANLCQGNCLNSEAMLASVGGTAYNGG